MNETGVVRKSSKTKASVRTQDELAHIVGVTRLTVNRALLDHPSVTLETRKRVQKVARELGYRPNAMARAMVSKRSHVVGLVMINTVVPGAELLNMPWFEILMGADVALREAGYIPAMIGVDDLGISEGSESRAFRERLADGILVLGNLPTDVDALLVAAFDKQLIRVEGNRWEPSGCIRRDEKAAGRLVAERLCAAGYRELVWLGHVEPECTAHFSSVERHAGFLIAAAEAGVPVREAPLKRDATEDQRLVLCRSLTSRSGIGCADAVLARQLADASAVLGRLAGRDYGLACCDDSQMIAQFFSRLARAKFNRLELGRQAAAMLLERIENPAALCPSRRPAEGVWIDGPTIFPAPPSGGATLNGNPPDKEIAP